MRDAVAPAILLAALLAGGFAAYSLGMEVLRALAHTLAAFAGAAALTL